MDNDLLRIPGSRPVVTTVPSWISKTSSSELGRFREAGWVQDRMILGPLGGLFTFTTLFLSTDGIQPRLIEDLIIGAAWALRDAPGR